jgi:hypothetical protein
MSYRLVTNYNGLRGPLVLVIFQLLQLCLQPRELVTRVIHGSKSAKVSLAAYHGVKPDYFSPLSLRQLSIIDFEFKLLSIVTELLELIQSFLVKPGFPVFLKGIQHSIAVGMQKLLLSEGIEIVIAQHGEYSIQICIDKSLFEDFGKRD